jgi:hypothetical protein
MPPRNDWRGAALTCVSRPDGICSIAYLAETGENRRLPRTTQRLVALLACRTETSGQSIALGNSREPPAVTFSSRNP